MTSSNRPSIDRQRIHLDDPYQAGYWAARLHVTPEALRDAVAAVGNMAKAVQQYFGITHGSRRRWSRGF